MRPIRVNADYDEVLAGRPPRALQVRAIECLAFWVQDAPVAVEGEYAEDYLIHVAHHSGRMPRPVRDRDAQNWWGQLTDLPLERRLNSKLWARNWWANHYRYEGGVAFDEASVLALLNPNGATLVKRDHGMSGRGHWVIPADEWEAQKARVLPWLADGVVVEPLYARTQDVSALWLPEENRFIYYRNQVDARFQWRGCRIEREGAPNFDVAQERALAPWREQLDLLARDVRSAGHLGPFSVDAFFYRGNDGELFMPCTEINARKTMGWVAYNLAKCLGQDGGCLELGTEGLALAPAGSAFPWVWRT